MGLGTVARRPAGQQLAYLGPLTVNFDTPGVAAGIPLGTLPRGSMIVGIHSRVNVTFNAATTNVLTVGTTGDAGIDNIADAGQLAEVVGYQLVQPLAAFAPVAVDTEVRVAYNQTGTAATTGQALVSMLYIPPDALE